MPYVLPKMATQKFDETEQAQKEKEVTLILS
jgi:hypothetical protein